MELQKKLVDARAAYQSCIASFAESKWAAESYRRAGWCSGQLRDFAAAEQFYEDLQRARPRTQYPIIAQWRLSELLVLQRKYAEAIAEYGELKGMLKPEWGDRIDGIIAEVSEKILQM